MRTLYIDIETYSDRAIDYGVHAYVDADNFQILLFAYAFDDEDVEVIDFTAGEKLPESVAEALVDPGVIKTAFNANFEITCLACAFPELIKPEQWECDKILAHYHSIGASLATVGKALGLPEDKQKDARGKRLITYFCKPCKPTKRNGGRTRNLPEHAPEDWEVFKEYNRQDVVTERAIRHELEWLRPDKSEHDLWLIDRKINCRGVHLDMALVDAAIKINEDYTDTLIARAKELTGLENPNSVAQLKEWFRLNGHPIASLNKETVEEMLKDDNLHPVLKEVLRIRARLGKTSIKKYIAMRDSLCSDGRAHDLFQFYGASRTGRWAGRNIQLQNLPRNYINDLETAREAVKSGDMEWVKLMYGNVPDTLSQLIRTAIIPAEGKKFVVADFSAIEARVLAWLADETWVLDAFRAGKDIYCETASQMFNVPVEKHGQNSELRQKGKVATLACIAEGELVLTDSGLKPIEKVSCADRVWDGESFVRHEGVIYKGVKDVIEYEGLRATTDHLVYVEGQQRPIQFGLAAASGAHLIQAGDGRRAIRACSDYQPREALDKRVAQTLCADEMCALRERTMDNPGELNSGEIQGLSAMLSAETNPAMAGQAAHGGKATLREPQRPSVSSVWCARDKVFISVCERCMALDNQAFRPAGALAGVRPNRQQRALCTGEHPVCHKASEQRESACYGSVRIRPAVLALCAFCCDSEAVGGRIAGADYRRCQTSSIRETKELATYCGKAHVYDIRNAGQHHRYTVSGKLVHNCGYGGGIGALLAMGGDKMGLSEQEMQHIITRWRKSSPHIVQFWYTLEKAARRAIQRKLSTTLPHGIKFMSSHGHLLVQLPSKRYLVYLNARMGTNKFGDPSIVYDGVDMTKKAAGAALAELETYSGKLAENITQAVARDCLAIAMKNVEAANYPIVAHIHDEVVLEVPDNDKYNLDEAIQLMTQNVDWNEGLPLNAAGFESYFYMKD